MKKVRKLLMAAGVTVLLAGCGPAQNSDTAAAPTEEEARQAVKKMAGFAGLDWKA